MIEYGRSNITFIKALSIKNTSDAIAGLEDFERDDIGIPDAIGRMQQTIALTESGLCSLVLTCEILAIFPI